MTLSPIGTLHNKLVCSRRVRILSDIFAEMAPKNACILDVGCGDGTMSALLKSKRPDISIQGIDVLQREVTYINVGLFDGKQIPFAAESFDAVLFSDVLHHTHDPLVLQREAHRVSKQWVLIKDHYRKGVAADLRLRFMDWVGNARFGVALPYNYWTESQWNSGWRELGLTPGKLITRLGLYPLPADWLFGAQLHFVVLLHKNNLVKA